MPQDLDSRLERMRLEAEEMQAKMLELRVQTAINANRLVRLDNPIVFSRLDTLQAELEALMQESTASLLSRTALLWQSVWGSGFAERRPKSQSS